MARTPFQPLAPVARLAGSVTLLAAGDANVLVVMDDGSLYTDPEDGWRRMRDLPGRIRPLDVVHTGLGWIVLQAARDHAPAVQLDVARSATQPFEPGGAALVVTVFQRNEWLALAAAPSEVELPRSEKRRPRLARLGGELRLFWLREERGTLVSATLDLPTGRWSAPALVSPLEGASRFWVMELGGVPAVVLARPTSDGGDELQVLRQFTGGASEWRPAAMQWSKTPAESGSQSCKEAVGFSQHLAVLSHDAAGRGLLRYGRVGELPLDAAIDLHTGLDGPRATLQVVTLVHAAMLLLLFGTVAVLFLLRRDSLTDEPVISPGVDVALVFQRLVGGLIDFAPFWILAGIATGVNLPAAFQELLRWSIGFEGPQGLLPAAQTLTWWGVACAGYIVYTLVMELLLRRTAGKWLVGTRVVNEDGERAAHGAIMIRNLVRVLELLPPLWVLNAIMVLSRRRQRAGDLFARTLVVRLLPSLPPEND